MPDNEKRRLRDEVAALAEAVRELRDQLATQAAQPCVHWHFTPIPALPAAAPYVPPYTTIPPYIVSSGTNTIDPPPDLSGVTVANGGLPPGGNMGAALTVVA